MDMRLRAVCETLSLLSFAALLTACGGGGDGGGHPEVNFSMNGRGTCGTTVVQVDLGAANAELSHRPDVCQLDDSLAQRGCVADFANLQPQDVLRVTISGCTVPASTDLFRCGFHAGDLDELGAGTDATCTCATRGCDATPPICADGGSNSTSCETCNNGLDDDGNGLFDCEDPFCSNSIFCVHDGSTSTSSTTTTTLGGDAPVWNVVIRLAVDQLVGALQWDMNYAATGGSVVGIGDAVDCTPLLSGGIVAAHDDDAAQELTVGIVVLTGIDGPADLLECRVQAATKPEASDFVFSNIEASTVDSLPITDTSGFFQVASIVGENGTTTTTESSPTTTAGATTSTTMTDTTTTTVTTTTTMPVGVQAYTIRYSLTASTAELSGALQWKTDYASAPGTFQGAGAAVACTSTIPGLFAPNDVDATKQLTLGVVSFTGFAAPSILADCVFLGSAGDPPVPADFPFVIEDQTDVLGFPMTATIAVTVLNP